MSSYTPAVLIAPVAEPVMAQNLCVKIVCFEGGVVNMGLRSLKEKEAVMINHLRSSVQMQESGYIPPCIIMNKLFRLSKTLNGGVTLVELTLLALKLKWVV
jgi:hypothetical protein